MYQRSGNLSAVSRDELRKFKDAWLQFDPTGTGYITIDDFPKLLSKLHGTIFHMGIYDDEHSVHSILEDCRTDLTSGPGIVDGVDIEALNRRLAQIPIHKIRRQRHIYNLFYEEVVVTADKELGISFTSVLLILAHYKIIDDTKALKLEEFLRRRWRLQKVEDQVRRNTVTNFFLTLYWHRRFKMGKTDAPPGATPFTFASPFSPSKSANIPQILVDTDDRPASNPFASEPSTAGIPRIEVQDDSFSATGPTDGASSPAKRSSSPFDNNRPSSLQFTPPGSAWNSRQSSPSRTPPRSPTAHSHLSSRAASPVSAQTVIEDALETSEWGSHLRSAMGDQLSPTSPVFATSSGGMTTGFESSRSGTSSPTGRRSRAGSTAAETSRPGGRSRAGSSVGQQIVAGLGRLRSGGRSKERKSRDTERED